MKPATSFPALVALLTLNLGPCNLPAALALSVPHYHGALLPRQTNTTTGLDNGATCSFGFECLTSFCRGTTCVDPATIVGQVQDGGECFDSASCAGTGSVCDGVCIATSTPAPPTLTPNGQPCAQAANCTSGFCTKFSNGQCADPNSATGQSQGDPCRTDSNCASTLCQNGACAVRSTTNTTTLIPTNSGGCGSADIVGDARCELGYCFEARDDPYCADPRDISDLLVGQHCFSGGRIDGQNCISGLDCSSNRICVNTTITTTPNATRIIATSAPCTYLGSNSSFISARQPEECWSKRLNPSLGCDPSGVCQYPNDRAAVQTGGACSSKLDCFGATGGTADCVNIDPNVVGSGTCQPPKVKTFIVPTSQSCADAGAECWSGKDKCPGAAANTSTISTANVTRVCLPLDPLATEAQACSAQADCGRAFNRTMACVGLVSDKVGAGKCERIKPYELEETCADSKECRSLNCENKVCKRANPGPDPVNTPCNVSTTCTTSFCAPRGQAGTVQVCTVPFTGLPNSTCTVDEICLSARCLNSKCSSTVVPDVVVDRNAATVSTDDKKGLSTAVLVGIIVGAVAGLAVLAGLLFFLIKALKGATVATSALHATNAAQQAHNAQNQNQDPHQDDHKPDLKIQEFSILMIGLDRAGKSMFVGKAQSVLNFIKFKPADIRPNPVKKGFKETKIAFLNAILTFQDQSGAFARRPKWLETLSDHHAVCFVVDATDKARINEAYAALQQVLSSPWMTGIPVLVLVNKLDSPQAEPFAQVQAHFNILLSQRPVGSAWSVMGISAMSGQGLSDAVQWLYTWCQSSKKTIQDAATANAFSNGLTYV